MLATAFASCTTTADDAFPDASELFGGGTAALTHAGHLATAQPGVFRPGHFAPTRAPQRAVVNQPRGMFFVRGAAGDAELEQIIGPVGAKTDTNATFGEIGVEGVGKVMGGGLRFGAYRSDDDLSGPGLRQRGDGAHFFAHLTIRPGGSRFRVPIRIGPDIRANALENYLPSLQDVDWISVGGAIEVEPEFDFFRSRRAALSIYGRLHAGAGVAQISDDTNEFDTEATHLGGEVGLRLQLARFLLAGGYLVQQTEYDRADPDGLTPSPYGETNWGFEGIFFMIGVRW